MNKNFRNLLKTTAALATLMMGSNVWGVGVWVDADTGVAPSGAASSILLTAGDSSTATAAPTGAVTVTATSDLVISCVLAGTTANDILPLVIDPNGHAVTVVLSKANGKYSLQPSSKAPTGGGSLVVKVEEDLSVTMAHQALAWNYKVSPTKTLTITAGANITGTIKAAGAAIVTPAAARTINFD